MEELQGEERRGQRPSQGSSQISQQKRMEEKVASHLLSLQQPWR